jgi:hypothetical protein
MSSYTTLPKSDPRAVARAAVDGIEAGLDEVLADDFTRAVRGALGGDPTSLLG